VAYSSTIAPGQTLLLDADDTLWENNIYFERAIADFISYLDHQHHSHQEVREFLNDVERETVRERGYGLASFQHSLIVCFERLSNAPITPEKHERVVGFARSISRYEIQLLPGVSEVLPALASRHKLILMTKGNEFEQKDKLARSGLAHHFSAVEVPKEKDPDAYHFVRRKYDLDCHCTWMVGNSPKSDINPALAAGLHAVFIPHPHTWMLEHEAVEPAQNGQQLLQLESFRELGLRF
jgi:putative hydrolase of the HAD superfamily